MFKKSLHSVRIVLLIFTALFSCKSKYNKEDNLIWLDYLASKKISSAALVGAFNAERYNTIDTVRIKDISTLNKISTYSLDRVLVARNSVNLKALRYSCSIILYKRDESNKIYLSYTLDNKGIVDFGDEDSLFQANRLIYYVDSIFHSSYKTNSINYNKNN